MTWQALADGKALCRVADAFDAFMSGAHEARQNKDGLVRLIYTDMTEELVSCPDLDIGDESVSWFTIVSRVQRDR